MFGAKGEEGAQFCVANLLIDCMMDLFFLCFGHMGTCTVGVPKKDVPKHKCQLFKALKQLTDTSSCKYKELIVCCMLYIVFSQELIEFHDDN